VAIVKGYLSMAVVLGFFELVFWVLDQRACAREQWRTEAPATARTASHRLACRLQKEMMGIVREKKVVSWAT
jgi:hypothetical protein